jgi:hypothetical protein
MYSSAGCRGASSLNTSTLTGTSPTRNTSSSAPTQEPAGADPDNAECAVSDPRHPCRPGWRAAAKHPGGTKRFSWNWADAPVPAGRKDPGKGVNPSLSYVVICRLWSSLQSLLRDLAVSLVLLVVAAFAGW